MELARKRVEVMLRWRKGRGDARGERRHISPVWYLLCWGDVTSGVGLSHLRMKNCLENIGSQNSVWWWYGPWLSVPAGLLPEPERFCSQARSSWLVLLTSTGQEGTFDLPTQYMTPGQSVSLTSEAQSPPWTSVPIWKYPLPSFQLKY